MQFNICNRSYSVFIWPRPIVRAGKPRQAWLDHAAGRILISVEVPREDRRRLLFHELRHASTAETGLPAPDLESDACNVAAFTDEILSQYESEGGDDVLLAMNPPPDAVPPASAARILLDRRTCGRCGSDVMAGSFVNDPPAFDDKAGIWTMNRAMVCDCGGVTCWVEQCTDLGAPLGRSLEHPQPRVLAGAELRAWQIEHEDRLLTMR